MTAAKARTPLEALHEFVRTYNERDIEGNHALIDPSFRRFARTTDWAPMRYETYKEILKPWMVAFPDFSWEVASAVADQENIAARIIERGTFMHPYEYKPGAVIPPTGQFYTGYCAIFAKVNEKGLFTEYHLYEEPSWSERIKLDAA